MSNTMQTNESKNLTSYLKKAYFAGGCFWGVEHLMKQQDGVLAVISGYMGGHVEHPTYNQVCQHNTGHVEAVEVLYNSNQVTYEALARLFFEIHDPTQHDGQSPDKGNQYASVIFYSCDEEKQTADYLINKLETIHHFRPYHRLSAAILDMYLVPQRVPTYLCLAGRILISSSQLLIFLEEGGA